MDHCLHDPYIFEVVITVKDNSGDLPFSAGKTTIDVSDFNYFKVLRSFLDRLSLEGLEF